MAYVTRWSVDDVADWVEQCLQLPYADKFRDAEINGAAFVEIGDEQMVTLGIEDPSHILRLLSHIAVFRMQLGKSLLPNCKLSSGSFNSSSSSSRALGSAPRVRRPSSADPAKAATGQSDSRARSHSSERQRPSSAPRRTTADLLNTPRLVGRNRKPIAISTTNGFSQGCHNQARSAGDLDVWSWARTVGGNGDGLSLTSAATAAVAARSKQLHTEEAANIAEEAATKNSQLHPIDWWQWRDKQQQARRKSQKKQSGSRRSKSASRSCQPEMRPAVATGQRASSADRASSRSRQPVRSPRLYSTPQRHSPKSVPRASIASTSTAAPTDTSSNTSPNDAKKEIRPMVAPSTIVPPLPLRQLASKVAESASASGPSSSRQISASPRARASDPALAVSPSPLSSQVASSPVTAMTNGSTPQITPRRSLTFDSEFGRSGRTAKFVGKNTPVCSRNQLTSQRRQSSPAAFNTSSTVGMSHGSPRTMPWEQSAKVAGGPGPGAYKPQNAMIAPGVAGGTFPGDARRTLEDVETFCRESPGAGKYTPREAQHIPRLTRGGSFGSATRFRYQWRLREMEHTPGPASYTPRHSYLSRFR